MSKARSSFLGSLPALPRWFTRRDERDATYTPGETTARSNGISVSLEDRWFIGGTTGTGKTTFAKQLVKELLRSYTVPLYVLDSKALGDFKEWHHGLVTDEQPPAAITSGVQIWQPGVDNQNAYDWWFTNILRSPGPSILLIDEISSLKKNANSDAPPGFQRLLKQGRAAGKLVVNCTQEMAGQPRQIITQTTHTVGFRMGGDYDQRVLNKLIGRDGSAPTPRATHGFFYRRMDRQMSPIEYTSYKDFF